jgi:prepilin-type N-terminal cleavage/methylation domain-containing protein
MKNAFTLVELLVVIAILGVLLALGLPVMRLAREHSAEAVCQSNLRQMAMILRTYGGDHDGAFPDPSYLYHSRKSLDANEPIIYRMGCRWHDARIGPGSPLLCGRKDLQGSLISYLGNPQILLCPTGARANAERGCRNRSPVATYYHAEQSENHSRSVTIGTGLPHENIPILPQYLYTMNGNLYRTLVTARLTIPSHDTVLNPKTIRKTIVARETQVTRSPAEVFVFGEENSWVVNKKSRWPAAFDLSGPGLPPPDAYDTTDGFTAMGESSGTLTLGSLDITPYSTTTQDSSGRWSTERQSEAFGDALATYHRPRGGDLNTGHSYISLLDGHVQKVTVSDQLRKSQQIPEIPPSRLGPGGNLHLAWPLDVPPPGGWENQ